MATSTRTRQLVTAFDAARRGGSLLTAREYLSSTFRFESPMFRFDDPDEYLTSYRDFQRMVTGRDVMAELFDEDKAVLIYDLHTATPAGTRRTAEWFRVDQSKTRSILLIFDATPWRPILRLRQPRESFEEKLKIGVL